MPLYSNSRQIAVSGTSDRTRPQLRFSACRQEDGDKVMYGSASPTTTASSSSSSSLLSPLANRSRSESNGVAGDDKHSSLLGGRDTSSNTNNNSSSSTHCIKAVDMTSNSSHDEIDANGVHGDTNVDKNYVNHSVSNNGSGPYSFRKSSPASSRRSQDQSETTLSCERRASPPLSFGSVADTDCTATMTAGKSPVMHDRTLRGPGDHMVFLEATAAAAIGGTVESPTLTERLSGSEVGDSHRDHGEVEGATFMAASAHSSDIIKRTYNAKRTGRPTSSFPRVAEIDIARGGGGGGGLGLPTPLMSTDLSRCSLHDPTSYSTLNINASALSSPETDTRGFVMPPERAASPEEGVIEVPPLSSTLSSLRPPRPHSISMATSSSSNTGGAAATPYTDMRGEHLSPSSHSHQQHNHGYEVHQSEEIEYDACAHEQQHHHQFARRGCGSSNSVGSGVGGSTTIRDVPPSASFPLTENEREHVREVYHVYIEEVTAARHDCLRNALNAIDTVSTDTPSRLSRLCRCLGIAANDLAGGDFCHDISRSNSNINAEAENDGCLHHGGSNGTTTASTIYSNTSSGALAIGGERVLTQEELARFAANVKFARAAASFEKERLAAEERQRRLEDDEGDDGGQEARNAEIEFDEAQDDLMSAASAKASTTHSSNSKHALRRSRAVSSHRKRSGSHHDAAHRPTNSQTDGDDGLLSRQQKEQNVSNGASVRPRPSSCSRLGNHTPSSNHWSSTSGVKVHASNDFLATVDSTHIANSTSSPSSGRSRPLTSTAPAPQKARRAMHRKQPTGQLFEKAPGGSLRAPLVPSSSTAAATMGVSDTRNKRQRAKKEGEVVSSAHVSNCGGDRLAESMEQQDSLDKTEKTLAQRWTRLQRRAFEELAQDAASTITGVAALLCGNHSGSVTPRHYQGNQSRSANMSNLSNSSPRSLHAAAGGGGGSVLGSSDNSPAAPPMASPHSPLSDRQTSPNLTGVAAPHPPARLTVWIATFLKTLRMFELEVDLKPFHGIELDRGLDGTMTLEEFMWLTDRQRQIIGASPPLFKPLPRKPRSTTGGSVCGTVELSSFTSSAASSPHNLGLHRNSSSLSCSGTYPTPPRPVITTTTAAAAASLRGSIVGSPTVASLASSFTSVARIAMLETEYPHMSATSAVAELCRGLRRIVRQRMRRTVHPLTSVFGAGTSRAKTDADATDAVARENIMVHALRGRSRSTSSGISGSSGMRTCSGVEDAMDNFDASAEELYSDDYESAITESEEDNGRDGGRRRKRRSGSPGVSQQKDTTHIAESAYRRNVGASTGGTAVETVAVKKKRKKDKHAKNEVARCADASRTRKHRSKAKYTLNKKLISEGNDKGTDQSDGDNGKKRQLRPGSSLPKTPMIAPAYADLFSPYLSPQQVRMFHHQQQQQGRRRRSLSEATKYHDGALQQVASQLRCVQEQQQQQHQQQQQRYRSVRPASAPAFHALHHEPSKVTSSTRRPCSSLMVGVSPNTGGIPAVMAAPVPSPYAPWTLSKSHITRPVVLTRPSSARPPSSSPYVATTPTGASATVTPKAAPTTPSSTTAFNWNDYYIHRQWDDSTRVEGSEEEIRGRNEAAERFAQRRRGDARLRKWMASFEAQRSGDGGGGGTGVGQQVSVTTSAALTPTKDASISSSSSGKHNHHESGPAGLGHHPPTKAPMKKICFKRQGAAAFSSSFSPKVCNGVFGDDTKLAKKTTRQSSAQHTAPSPSTVLSTHCTGTRRGSASARLEQDTDVRVSTSAVLPRPKKAVAPRKLEQHHLMEPALDEASPFIGLSSPIIQSDRSKGKMRGCRIPLEIAAKTRDELRESMRDLHKQKNELEAALNAEEQRRLRIISEQRRSQPGSSPLSPQYRHQLPRSRRSSVIQDRLNAVMLDISAHLQVLSEAQNDDDRMDEARNGASVGGSYHQANDDSETVLDSDVMGGAAIKVSHGAEEALRRSTSPVQRFQESHATTAGSAQTHSTPSLFFTPPLAANSCAVATPVPPLPSAPYHRGRRRLFCNHAVALAAAAAAQTAAVLEEKQRQCDLGMQKQQERERERQHQTSRGAPAQVKEEDASIEAPLMDGNSSLRKSSQLSARLPEGGTHTVAQEAAHGETAVDLLSHLHVLHVPSDTGATMEKSGEGANQHINSSATAEHDTPLHIPVSAVTSAHDSKEMEELLMDAPSALADAFLNQLDLASSAWQRRRSAEEGKKGSGGGGGGATVEGVLTLNDASSSSCASNISSQGCASTTVPEKVKTAAMRELTAHHMHAAGSAGTACHSSQSVSFTAPRRGSSSEATTHTSSTRTTTAMTMMTEGISQRERNYTEADEEERFIATNSTAAAVAHTGVLSAPAAVGAKSGPMMVNAPVEQNKQNGVPMGGGDHVVVEGDGGGRGHAVPQLSDVGGAERIASGNASLPSPRLFSNSSFAHIGTTPTDGTVMSSMTTDIANFNSGGGGGVIGVVPPSIMSQHSTTSHSHATTFSSSGAPTTTRLRQTRIETPVHVVDSEDRRGGSNGTNAQGNTSSDSGLSPPMGLVLGRESRSSIGTMSTLHFSNAGGRTTGNTSAAGTGMGFVGSIGDRNYSSLTPPLDVMLQSGDTTFGTDMIHRGQESLSLQGGDISFHGHGRGYDMEEGSGGGTSATAGFPASFFVAKDSLPTWDNLQ